MLIHFHLKKTNFSKQASGRGKKITIQSTFSPQKGSKPRITAPTGNEQMQEASAFHPDRQLSLHHKSLQNLFVLLRF